jgi:hypothetical protein
MRDGPRFYFLDRKISYLRKSQLGGHRVDATRESRFVSSGSVLMEDAFLNRLVDERYGADKELLRLRGIACFHRGSKLLDFSAEAVAIAAIGFIASFRLPVSLQRRFVISHVSPR